MASDSDDDMPLQQRKAASIATLPFPGSESEDDVPLANRAVALKPKANGKAASSNGISHGVTTAANPNGREQLASLDHSHSSSSEDDIPLAQRQKALSAQPKGKMTKPIAKDIDHREGKRKREDAAPSGREAPAKRKAKTTDDPPPRKKRAASSQGAKEEDKEIKWEKLQHAGVLFPPEYSRLPSSVKMLYDGEPVELTAEQEEIANMFGVMKETDYMKKQIFLDNFWNDFRKVLGKNHVIKDLKKCDFTPMYEYAMAERERKKQLSKEEKLENKLKKEADEKKFKFAKVDGRTEQVGNFRVEPPGLFRGRGEHPKMGKVKTRIYPRDITINIGGEEAVPEHPYPGQQWKEVRHDKTVTWLAFWKDPISQKDFKYVWLAANSTFKSDSDLAKYEKARKLKHHVDDIRKMYTADWDSKDVQRQQMGCALYFIDQLALRAGHEKDDDEADTVGCCTLKVENVECMPGDHIKFDFLGKDSIRYENEVVVNPKVYQLIKKFCQQFANKKRKFALPAHA
ncbi:DNA topoisomerase 1 [Trebouxia sp. C0010 RCD-2024]